MFLCYFPLLGGKSTLALIFLYCFFDDMCEHLAYYETKIKLDWMTLPKLPL